MKLEQGKWYKITNLSDNWWIKFDGIKNSIVTASEYINNNHTTCKEGNFGTIGTYSYELLTDLTELEPYLPEGHPDKKFVLPECWYIQLTEENQEDIIKWHKTKDAWSTRVYTLESYYGWKDGEPDAWQIGYLPENSNLITYNQFKKYVLNQQEENYSYLDKLLSKWNIK